MKLRFTRYALQSPRPGLRAVGSVRKKLMALEPDPIGNAKV